MILVIQNGHITTNIGKYLDEEFEIVKSSDIENMVQIDLEGYSIVIILGGHQQIRDINKHENLFYLSRVVRKCIKMNKPVLGICLGCQLIGHLLGCNITSSDQLNLGCDTKVLGFEHIFRCHYDYVEASQKINVIETFNGMTYVFEFKKLLGIQCHPDIPPENILDYCPDSRCISYVEQHRGEIDSNNRRLMKYLLNYLRNEI